MIEKLYLKIRRKRLIEFTAEYLRFKFIDVDKYLSIIDKIKNNSIKNKREVLKSLD